ncbi:Uma2 family endonuclease [Kineococcus sp. LSe6-4]|uniref:Uma2 family endonuclease n=1 Tax=Kineococcus halophytocola TaxID=3234027 RepID=A0ABV4GZ48_9ACTN
MTPRGTFEHQDAADNLRAVLEGAGFVAVTEWAWRPLGTQREHQPDVMVLDQAPADRRVNWTETTPALVVEVTSPGDASKDWVRTLRDDARFGAAHHWILDHRDHRLYAFALRGGQYDEVVQGEAPLRVPGWDRLGEIDVPALWR